MFASTLDGNARIRRAEADEALAVADLWLQPRRAASPAIPQAAHSDADVRAWFRDIVFSREEVWVIGPYQRPEAMMVLSGDWIDQLYVAPGHQRRGHGSRLIGFAQSRRSELHLWSFEANASARAFYEHYGFTAVGAPSSDNEEGAPAVRYGWSKRRVST